MQLDHLFGADPGHVGEAAEHQQEEGAPGGAEDRGQEGDRQQAVEEPGQRLGDAAQPLWRGSPHRPGFAAGAPIPWRRLF